MKRLLSFIRFLISTSSERREFFRRCYSTDKREKFFVAVIPRLCNEIESFHVQEMSRVLFDHDVWYRSDSKMIDINHFLCWKLAFWQKDR